MSGHTLPRPSMGLKRFGLTALGMYGIHPIEDAVQSMLGWQEMWGWVIACAIVFPLICAGLAEVTHGKKMHQEDEECPTKSS